MRRNDREITNTEELIGIIEKCKVCRLGLSCNNIPYVIPLNFGFSFQYNQLSLFFHSAVQGKKIDIIRDNNNGCFEIDCDSRLVIAEKPCAYGYLFKSVIGFGKIFILNSSAEKTEGLNLIMKHQTGKDIIYNYSDDDLKNVCVYKLVVDSFTGKQKVH